METAGAFLACFSFGDVTVGADVEERFLEGDVSVVLGDAFGVVYFREERLSFLRNMQKGVYHDRNMNMSWCKFILVNLFEVFSYIYEISSFLYEVPSF